MALFGFLKPDVDRLRREGDVPGLLKALRYKSDVGTREDAAWALEFVLESKRDATATEPLIAALRDPCPAVREGAATALQHLPSDCVVDALIQELGSWGVRGFPDVHEAVIESLGTIADRRAVEPLLVELRAAMQGSTSEQERVGVSFRLSIPSAVPLGRALRRFQDARALEAYLELFGALKSSPSSREDYERLVGDDLHADAMDVLEPAVFAEVLQSPNTAVLVLCLEEVGYEAINDLKVVRRVIELLGHPHEGVRRAARDAFGNCHRRECLEELARCADPDVRARAEAELRKITAIEAGAETPEKREAAEADYMRAIERGLDARDVDAQKAALEAAWHHAEELPEDVVKRLVRYCQTVVYGSHNKYFPSYQESLAMRPVVEDVIRRVAQFPHQHGSLRSARDEMREKGLRYDPMVDDSAHDLADRSAYQAAVALIDSVLK